MKIIRPLQKQRLDQCKKFLVSRFYLDENDGA